MSMTNEANISTYVMAEVTFKPFNQGGRPTMPIGNGFSPYLRSGLADEDLAVRVNNVPDGARFGEPICVSIELSYFPQFDYGALTEGVPIQLIEGPKVVAEGICKTAIITEKTLISEPRRPK